MSSTLFSPPTQPLYLYRLYASCRLSFPLPSRIFKKTLKSIFDTQKHDRVHFFFANVLFPVDAMQIGKTGRSRMNSKACDQCYRCKVKCTMELSGCGRCRLTGGACTYSLGKWMGRPKKSSQQISKAQARGTRDAGNASLEHNRNLSGKSRLSSYKIEISVNSIRSYHTHARYTTRVGDALIRYGRV